MDGKLDSYYILIETNERWSGVGGFCLEKFENIREAAKYTYSFIKDVEQAWWPDIDDEDYGYEDWIEFKANLEKLNSNNGNLIDRDLDNLYFDRGQSFNVVYAGDSKDTLRNMIQYIYENWSKAFGYDGQEEQSLKEDLLNCNFDEFKDKSLRRRLEIILHMMENNIEGYKDYLNLISYDDLYIC